MGVGWGLASEAWAEPGTVRVFRRRMPSGSPAEGKLAAYTARKLRGMLYGRGRRDGDFEGISLPRRAGRHKGLGPERENGVKMGLIQEKTKPARPEGLAFLTRKSVNSPAHPRAGGGYEC